MDNSNKPLQNPIFLNSAVRQGKDEALKNRLQALIHSKGLSEYDFYTSLGFSKQVWYALSWGIWNATPSTKIKIAQALETDSSVIWQEENKK